MGGGSAVDTSIVDSGSLGFTNVQEFADYVLAQMNNKVNSDKLGEYVHNQTGEIVTIQSFVTFGRHQEGELEGGEFRMAKPIASDCKMKDDVAIDVFGEAFRIFTYNYNNDNTWRIIAFPFWQLPSNSEGFVMHTAWCKPVAIQSGAPAETNFLWAY